ncbi:hypothetical protein [Neorhodopirellula pilleata]|uniref:hypothetical protein n=1 Tax=Neorhodopirellula pilleata TaxID=2714738 RepID=UPI0011B7EF25|nr:hypothetical protein [Neorhodopirellula pilleata]
MVIPCNTIEDFPSRLDSNDARSLLGGLTAAWHPRLIAATGRTPTWHRADEMPSPIRPKKSDTGGSPTKQNRLILIPEACFSVLPARFSEAVTDQSFAIIEPDSPEFVSELIVRVNSRADAIEQINAAIESLPDGYNGSIDWKVRSEGCEETDGRTIDENDFFALGYTWWQIQVLTRKLRYTSNLDQIHFENRLTAAARALIDAQATAACEAIHDCFDALAEERDHYFSSDPSIIDLTLLTPGTISKWIHSSTDASRPIASVLATPQNVLVDEDVAEAVLKQTDETSARFLERLSGDQIGWCGGGPSSEFHLETNSIDQVEQRLADAMSIVGRLTGNLPAVYARLGGGVAAQWLPSIVASGFQGVVPIDFINGRGFDNESKVILGEGSCEIEALTAKPLDADDDASFLTLATRLGEAIDGGEIATALMAHWPGQGCDSFQDVRRAATWTLALGKFWKIDEYFTEGERPYHHGQNPVATSSADTSANVHDAVSRSFALAEHLQQQTRWNLRGLLALIDPSTVAESELGSADAIELRRRIVEAMGLSVDRASQQNGQPSPSVALVNPHHPATREIVPISGKIAKAADSVFYVASEGGRSRIVADVPAWGFCIVGQDSGNATTERGPGSLNWIQKLGRSLRRPAGKILDGHRLSNEFMEVAISPEHGGINGIYSGRGRGNRFSTRLVMTPHSPSKTIASVCESVREIENSRISAVIELTGYFVTSDENAAQGDSTRRVLWTARYRLDRGSRRLRYQIRIDSSDQSLSSEQSQLPVVWQHLPSLRIAIADATPIVRSLVGERLQRTSARSFSSSMGFMIEEGEERQTLIASNRATLHRRVEERFIDSLLSPTEDGRWLSFEFGFDVPHPMASAKSFVRDCDALQDQPGSNATTSLGVPLLPTKPIGSFAQQGWLMHVAPASVEAQVVDVAMVRDRGDHLAIHFRIIQTAGRAAKASLRFCRGVHAVIEVSSTSRPLRSDAPDSVLELKDLESLAISQSVQSEADRVTWSQAAHGVVHLIVLFQAGELAEDGGPE